MEKPVSEANQMLSLMNVVLKEQEKSDERKRDIKFKDKKNYKSKKQ